MKRNKSTLILKALATIVVEALTTALAGPTNALEIPFSDTSGFSANAPASVVRLASGGAPLAGRGGLEFSNAVTVPPGFPIGDSTAPTNIWNSVAWGCQLLNASPSTGANAGRKNVRCNSQA